MMFSVVASNVYTFLMAYDRFLCVVWRPLLRRDFTRTGAVIAAFVAFIVAILMPILSLFVSDKGMENSLCIPTGDSVPMTFSLLYISLTLTLFILTSVVYGAIITKVQTSMQFNKVNRRLMKTLARIGAIIVSNLVISLTISVLFLNNSNTYRLP